MGFARLRLGNVVLAVALVLAPRLSSAQSQGTGASVRPTLPATTQQGGRTGPASGAPSAAAGAPGAAANEEMQPDPAGSAANAPAADAKGSGSPAGYAYSDKGARAAAPRARVHKRTGPSATFPGFEQLPDGGSRLFLHLSQQVPVEEKRTERSITYVLKGARARVSNDARALVTVHFNTPVYRARLAPHGADLHFVLELRSAATPSFKVVDNQDRTATLMIDFPKGNYLPGDGSETMPSEAQGGAAKNAKPAGKARAGAPAPTAPTTDDGPAPAP